MPSLVDSIWGKPKEKQGERRSGGFGDYNASSLTGGVWGYPPSGGNSTSQKERLSPSEQLAREELARRRARERQELMRARAKQAAKYGKTAYRYGREGARAGVGFARSAVARGREVAGKVSDKFKRKPKIVSIKPKAAFTSEEWKAKKEFEAKYKRRD